MSRSRIQRLREGSGDPLNHLPDRLPPLVEQDVMTTAVLVINLLQSNGIRFTDTTARALLVASGAALLAGNHTAESLVSMAYNAKQYAEVLFTHIKRQRTEQKERQLPITEYTLANRR